MIRRRLSDVELFHVTRDGLTELSDETLNLRLDALERAALADLLADLLADPAATLPDCPLSQLEPLEAI